MLTGAAERRQMEEDHLKQGLRNENISVLRQALDASRRQQLRDEKKVSRASRMSTSVVQTPVSSGYQRSLNGLPTPATSSSQSVMTDLQQRGSTERVDITAGVPQTPQQVDAGRADVSAEQASGTSLDAPD